MDIIHTSSTKSVLTLLFFNSTTFLLLWPCLLGKNSKYGLVETCTTVARALTAARRALTVMRGMRELEVTNILIKTSVALENIS